MVKNSHFGGPGGGVALMSSYRNLECNYMSGRLRNRGNQVGEEELPGLFNWSTWSFYLLELIKSGTSGLLCIAIPLTQHLTALASDVCMFTAGLEPPTSGL